MTTMEHELPQYADWRPTAFDCRGLSLPDRQDWLVTPLTITRDTEEALTLSNWEQFQEGLGTEEGDGWEIHRFGHWGPGWVEIILLDPSSPVLERALDMLAALEDYPCLDEMALSAKESEIAEEAWASWQRSDVLRAVVRDLEPLAPRLADYVDRDENPEAFDEWFHQLRDREPEYYCHGEAHNGYSFTVENVTREDYVNLYRLLTA